MTEEKKFTTISIPTPLAEKIKKRIKGTGFTSKRRSIFKR
jgi:hypothetical protein